MPGFIVCGTGNSRIPATLETRRKHRWVFEAIGGLEGNDQLALLVLQSAQRPNFKLEEPEMHHDQEVARFAGKQSWEPISLKWYDCEQPFDGSRAIYNWLATVVDITRGDVNPPSIYKKQARLSMTNGTGVPSESWTICNCWPKEVNWGDLDYTSTDIATIEAQMRYDRAMRG